jgi:hypothetical protein
MLLFYILHKVTLKFLDEMLLNKIPGLSGASVVPISQVHSVSYWYYW